MNIVKKSVFCIFHWMQQHYVTFRLLVWLKEQGITRRVAFLISKDDSQHERNHPTEEMKEAVRFFYENKDRVKAVMSMLADDKSRAVMEEVLNYRMKRTPISIDLYSENDQYFVEDIVRLQDGEVFVDGGAYTGDTTQQLIDTARKHQINVKKIIAFEPDKNNYNLMKKFYGKRKQIKIINKGFYSREDSLYFDSERDAGARIVEDKSLSTTKIDVINIDAVPECKNATFIKMDIEGAEWNALHGAEETIKRNHPKLAICIYQMKI